MGKHKKRREFKHNDKEYEYYNMKNSNTEKNEEENIEDKLNNFFQYKKFK
ncbi:hypothetical protein [uncultured Clostridium sp.]|nr:hypothetical protein [uncultured Clostridium sp.]